MSVRSKGQKNHESFVSLRVSLTLKQLAADNRSAWTNVAEPPWFANDRDVQHEYQLCNVFRTVALK